MTEETNVQLTLNDIASVVRLIDVCTERGAFKGAELSTVGALRETYVAFLEANRPEEEPEGEAEAS